MILHHSFIQYILVIELHSHTNNMSDNSCSVFIGSLSPETTNEQLIELFSQVGPVVDLKIVYDRETQKSKNFAFCLFNDHETAKSAVRNLNKHEVNGRPICVSEANKKDKPKIKPPSADNNSCSVFIGNISYDTTEEQLQEIFSQIGAVKSLRFVYDSETKKSKNFGFCQYHDQATATHAIRSLNKHEINGRSLRVSVATKKEKSYENTEINSDNPTEAISMIVGRMPPQEMSEFVAETIKSFETFPNETHQMLIAHPQLAYALLQTLVATGIVEPEAAITMLHPETKVNKFVPISGFDQSLPPLPPLQFNIPPPPLQFNFPPPPIPPFNCPPPIPPFDCPPPTVQKFERRYPENRRDNERSDYRAPKFRPNFDRNRARPYDDYNRSRPQIKARRRYNSENSTSSRE